MAAAEAASLNASTPAIEMVQFCVRVPNELQICIVTRQHVGMIYDYGILYVP